MTAMPAQSKTPEGVSINARNVNFQLEQALATDWADSDPVLTAIFNAMSISFPSGEKNFIDSVRAYEKRINDEKLLKDIKGFYKQEGIHSREHRKYNKTLCEQRGYNLEELESTYLRRIETAKKDPRITNQMMLASTVAVEHFTASFGDACGVGSRGCVVERRWFKVGLELVGGFFIAGHARVGGGGLHSL